METDAPDPQQLFGDIRDEHEWRWIPGYEGFYFATNDGDIYTMRLWGSKYSAISKTAKRLKATLDKTTGYLKVCLSKDGNVKNLHVHALVAAAFYGWPSEGQVCCHLDGNRTNNVRENILHASEATNSSHKEAHGTKLEGVRHPNAKLSESDVIAIRADSRPPRVIGTHYGVSRGTIVDIRTGRTWKGIAPVENKNEYENRVGTGG